MKGTIWKKSSRPDSYSPIHQHVKAEVAIIGGGITGISTALLLLTKGYDDVVLLEARQIGLGTTGHSTGNLYTPTEYTFQELKQKYDLETLRSLISSRKKALDLIEDTIITSNIDCDFVRRTMYIFNSAGSVDMDNEQKIAEQAGLQVADIPQQGFPVSFRQGIQYPDQAQFNPLKYIRHLAAQVEKMGGIIYENSRVISIEENKEDLKLKTKTYTIHANHVVHATHTPIGLQLQYHPFLGPYREYGIAAKLKSGTEYPFGIYWGHFDGGKFSFRSYAPAGDPYLICIGSMHKTGQAKDNKEHLSRVQEFMRSHFNVDEITHQWAGQNYKSADFLPYIGPKNNGSKQYFATGYSTDGLIYGTLAAMILSDQIMGTENPFSGLYRSNRTQPAKSTKLFIKENVNVAGEWIRDYLKKGTPGEADDLLPEEGKVLQLDKGKLAVYKNRKGGIQYLSPVCPHMRCHVHWNNAEKTWDCPCHGSRFDTDGTVIEGPSLDGLEVIDPEE